MGVIQAFVDTADSPFGCMALEKLFEIADVDGSGTIDRTELELALKKLGFSHLTEAQIDKIMDKADSDDNCVIDYDEFIDNAPKTLKTNSQAREEQRRRVGLLVVRCCIVPPAS